MPETAEPEAALTPFKEMFNRASVEWTADRLHGADPAFPKAAFVQRVMDRLPALELKGRSAWISLCIHNHLRKDYPTALRTLLAALEPDPGPPEGEEFGSFRYLPFGGFVSQFGLAHLDLSIHALREITKRFSMEFDIRPFLDQYPEDTLAHLQRWTSDPDWRVRRLVSEGSRPRLPWGLRLKRFIADPTPVLRLLTPLRHDPHSAVRRSVANNLNDISKDHPQRALDTLQRWHREPGHPTTLEPLMRHALRGLIKAGDPEALRLLGFHPEAQIDLLYLRSAQPALRIGETLEFQLALHNRSTEPARLSIDYAIHHRKKNGALLPKVFKLAKKILPPGLSLELNKRHSFKPVTTRVYYPGEHQLELLINGAPAGPSSKITFQLLPP